jgi:hypothetical protein
MDSRLMRKHAEEVRKNLGRLGSRNEISGKYSLKTRVWNFPQKKCQDVAPDDS